MSISLDPLPGTTRDPLYPDSDGEPMGETEYHILAITHLYSVLRQWYRRRDDVHVAANMLLYYDKDDPSKFRGPDVMVSKGVRGKHFRRSFRTWEEGVAPTVIIELTSLKTQREDQVEKPDVYASLGVKEYFLFDPEGIFLRPRLQGFRLVAGNYVSMPSNQGDRLSSAEIGLDLAIDEHLLRLIDPTTGQPLPTEEEYAEEVKRARRAEAEAKRKAKAAERKVAGAEGKVVEAERKAAEAERKAAEAESRIAEAQGEAEAERRHSAALAAEIARLRASRPPER